MFNFHRSIFFILFTRPEGLLVCKSLRTECISCPHCTFLSPSFCRTEVLGIPFWIVIFPISTQVTLYLKKCNTDIFNTSFINCSISAPPHCQIDCKLSIIRNSIWHSLTVSWISLSKSEFSSWMEIFYVFNCSRIPRKLILKTETESWPLATFVQGKKKRVNEYQP